MVEGTLLKVVEREINRHILLGDSRDFEAVFGGTANKILL